MSKRERWQLIFVVAIVAVALFSVFPIQGRVRLGLDLKGGVHLLLQAVGTAEVPVTDDSIERLIAVLRNRIDQYGIAEPVIQRQGKDRVVVDLPGVEDPEAALELIGKTAMLEFRQVVSVTPIPPRAPDRKNYGSDEEFQRAQERWRAMMAEIEENVRQMEEKAASDPNLIVAKEEESGRFYLLGTV
ncbi:MAG TPA: protein translocase subunit SecD, partial [Synergistaceae bacterium]|nr:protein translocase subunit SecD [Synergistaceae bacterium]